MANRQLLTKLSKNGSEIAFDFSSEAMNQLILRAAGEGIYGVNAEGKTTFVNPAAERMLGWNAEELVGHDMHSIVHHTHPDGSHYPEHDCPIYAAFRDGAVHQVDTEVFWRKDGTSFWVEYTSTPIRDRGHVVGAVIVFRDITQRREADEKLRAAHEEVDRLRERLELENAYLQEEIRIEGNHHGIVGRSAAIQKMLRQVELVAPTDATVLITGESGTGKELIARAIHDASKRSRRPLIRVNCATIPRELFESEFFGHAKGAFAGAARDGVGRFELADGGTLFLDEVADMPIELQGKLLRVLEESNFERVGEDADPHRRRAGDRGDQPRPQAGGAARTLPRRPLFPARRVPDRVRCRCASAATTFRCWPRISCRAKAASSSASCKLTEGDVRRLMQYDWPGNVRELENVIERAAILARHARLRIDLPAARTRRDQRSQRRPTGLLTDDERRERDRANILAALESCGGKVFGRGGAAELLDVKPTTLASRIKALGITFEKPREKNGRGAAAS